MSEQPVLFTRLDSIARVTLNRPAQGNAIDLPMARDLSALALQCDTDDSIRCVVLSGSGRMFCVGGDIGLFASAGSSIPALLAELAGCLHTALVRLARMQKPLLVLVNGPAAGAGLSLSLLGDVVIAARSAHFTSAYTGIGLSPDGGLTWILPRLVGVRRAQEIILTNRRIGSAEAQTTGLVTSVVDDEMLADAGNKMAESLSRSATRALGAARSLLLESFQSSYETQVEREARAIAAAGRDPESAEGIAAFLAKRPPNFPERR
jgi:2-(1,2-epoxy-1,2-dihydrophenyl)acetyl-CoA isomerase